MLNKIAKMSIEEKVAQLRGIWLKDLMEGDELSLEKCTQTIPHGIGHICQFGSSTGYSGDELAKIMHEVQQFVLNHTNSKIPVLFHEEVINGVASKGATVTPQMIGMACSFNPELVKQNAKNAAETMKKLGGYYALSPMMDIITDARWARGEEGFGEDSYVVSAFADAFIHGLQHNGVGATAKHYAGYGAENQEVDFFLNETLTPFEVAVTKSQVKAVMPGYHVFRDVPATCSQELLVQSLREHLGFDGVVVSDYGAINNIHNKYSFTNNSKDSAIKSIEATVDVDLPIGVNYQHLVDAVKNNEIDESVIDRALARVLSFKESLLPKDIVLQTGIDTDPDSHRYDALQSARESIVLLKNNGILPLKGSLGKVLVTGPNADSYYSLLGDYSWGGLAEFFHSIPVDRKKPYLHTLLDGIREFAQDSTEILFERGFSWVEDDKNAKDGNGGDEREKTANRRPLEVVPETNFDRTLQKACESDVIIVAVGENRYLCGEGTSRGNIDLPGMQEHYVEELIKTGKPVVMVVFGGRPMAIANLADKCAAVIYAWYPGEEGGRACGEILFGRTNPTAKLSVTIPNTNADVPVTLHDTDRVMMFPFGYGLSYTEYSYSDFCVMSEVDTAQGSFDIEFNVKNTGDYDGAEITQFYFENTAKNTRKVLGFAKTALKVGESKKVKMRFYLDQFGSYKNGEFTISSGDYRVLIASSSIKNEYEQNISIVGENTTKPKREFFFSESI